MHLPLQYQIFVFTRFANPRAFYYVSYNVLFIKSSILFFSQYGIRISLIIWLAQYWHFKIHKLSYIIKCLILSHENWLFLSPKWATPFSFNGFSPTPFAIVPYSFCCSYSGFYPYSQGCNPTWGIVDERFPSPKALGNFVAELQLLQRLGFWPCAIPTLFLLSHRHKLVSYLLWCRALCFTCS